MRTRIIHPGEADYPERARQTPAVASWCKGLPPTLYVRGELPAVPALSIIGSRKAASDSCAFAHALAKRLASAGWCIMSGGAKGVDAAAHRGAIAGGGKTVAVVTGGHDTRPFPKENASLFWNIPRRGGALVSLQRDGEARMQYQFLQRNHLMVALTEATIVIHARRAGGAVKAAAAAAKLGRPVWWVPESPWRTNVDGTINALRHGGRALWSIDDAIQELAPHAVVAPRLDDADQPSLWRVAGADSRHLDTLALRAELPHGRATEALLMLVLDGHLVEGPAAHYRRAPVPTAHEESNH